MVTFRNSVELSKILFYDLPLRGENDIENFKRNLLEVEKKIFKFLATCKNSRRVFEKKF